MSVMSPMSALRAVATIGAGVAKSKIAARGESTHARNYIIESLSNLGPGLGAKAAQVFSQHDEGSTPDFSTFMLSRQQIVVILREEAPTLASRVRELSVDGRQGSLGQVHRAVLDDGRQVAVKFQYPGIKDEVERQLGTLLKIVEATSRIKITPRLFKGFDEFLLGKFSQELDYREELDNQMRFQARFRADQAIMIPDALEELSTSKVFVQRWVPHNPLANAAKGTPSERTALASVVVRNFLTQLFIHNEVHGDLHQGNIGLSGPSSSAFVLYDFGSTLQIEPEHVRVIADAIACARNKRAFDSVEAFAALGFDLSAIAGMGQELVQLWQLILEPFLNDQGFDPCAWNFSERSAHILGKGRMAFRTAGPPWFLFFMRTYSNLIGCLKIMGAPSFPWWGLFEAVVGERLTPPNTHGNTGAAISENATVGAARHLYIRIVEDRVEKVFLEFPARSIEWIEDLIPEIAKERLLASGHDLRRIQRTALKSGCVAQVLFEASYDQKHIRAWLG